MSYKWVLIVQNSEEENRIIRLDTIRNEHQPRNELESFVLNWSSSIQFHGQRDKTRSMRRNCFLVSFLLRKSYVTRARIRLAFVCMERRSKRGAYSSRKRRSRWSAERCANVTRSSGSSARVVIVFSAVAGQSPISRDLVSPWSSAIENENREIRERRSWIGEMELYYVWRIRTENLRWKFLFLFIFSLRDRKISPTVSLVRYISHTPTACSNS